MKSDEGSGLIDRLGDAFAAADIERVVTLFAAEGDVMYAGSEPAEVAVGRPALRLLLTDLFSRSERYSWRCESVRCVDCAAGVLVVAETTLFVTEETAHTTGNTHCTTGVPYRISGLLESSTEGWRWRFCQGAEPAGEHADGSESAGAGV